MKETGFDDTKMVADKTRTFGAVLPANPTPYSLLPAAYLCGWASACWRVHPESSTMGEQWQIQPLTATARVTAAEGEDKAKQKKADANNNDI